MAEYFGRADVTNFAQEMTAADYMGWFALWAEDRQRSQDNILEVARALKDVLEKRRNGKGKGN